MARFAIGNFVMLLDGGIATITGIVQDHFEEPSVRYRICTNSSAQGGERQVEGMQIVGPLLESVPVANLQEATSKYVAVAEKLYGGGDIMYGEDWERNNPGKRRYNGHAAGFQVIGMTFTSLAGVNSSRTVETFFQSGTVCECHSLCLAVYYRSILDVLGANAFEVLFPKVVIEDGSLWQISTNPIKNVIDEFAAKTEDDIGLGDWVYARNRSDYKTKHPLGVAAGWNIICIDSKSDRKKYVGLGLGTAKGMTLAEIFDVLRKEYDKPSAASNKPDFFQTETKFRGLVEDQMTTVRSKKDASGNTITQAVTRLEPYLDSSFRSRRLNASKLVTYYKSKLQERRERLVGLKSANA